MSINISIERATELVNKIYDLTIDEYPVVTRALRELAEIKKGAEPIYQRMVLAMHLGDQ